jgi:cytochrome c oxidase assembly protein subunit 15
MSPDRTPGHRLEPSRAVTGGVGGRPHRLLRSTAVAATASALALIAVGALVRATGSGDGCPGWPRCFGRWVPPFTYHPGIPLTNALIEYSHRFTALLVGLFVVALAAVAWRRYRGVRRVTLSAAAALVLWLFQAVLGGLVVRYGLKPGLVTAHLATATLFVGTLVYATVASFSAGISVKGRVDRLTQLSWMAAGAVFALIVVGGLVRGEGAGLAFADWPLMDGRVIPALANLRPALQFAHRALAAIVGLGVVVVAARMWPYRRTRMPAAVLTVAAVGLFAGQVVIGAANVWTNLATAPVVAHVAVSSLIWGALVGAAASSRACGCKERMTWAAMTEGMAGERAAVAS